MNLLSCVDKVGKFAYFEPNDIERKGLSNEIFNSYEDYCISVSLLVQIGNRNSCGIGDNKTMYFTSENGTISFMGGMGGDSKGPGYLTSNFTEVNNVPGSSGNRECLGIESIDISYQSWFFPVVTIKFVDVRGSSLMNPSENSAREAIENHPQDISQGAGGSFYKALFMFPRPIFKLSVKGFYGREVTYDLTIRDSKIDFDSKSGNFSCTVNFIGYMYGVYTDIPMTYISVAPYIDKSGYWDSRVANGYFTIDGNPILTFPELKNRMYLLMNKENDKVLETEVGTIYKENREKIDELEKIKSETNNEFFPSQNWVRVSSGGTSCYAFVKKFENERDFEKIAKEVSDSLKKTIGSLDYNGIRYDFVSEYEDQDWKTCFVKKRDGHGKLEYFFKPQYLIKGRKWNIKDLFKFPSELDNTAKLYKIKKYDSNGDYICKNSNDGKDTDYVFNAVNIDSLSGKLKDIFREKTESIETEGCNYVVALLKSDFIESIDDKLKKIIEDQQILSDRLQEEKLELIRQTIGYDLTIKNVFKTVFAHLDTFVNFFYNALDEIRNLPDSDRKVSAIPDYYKLDVSRTNPDLKLSPFPLVVKQSGENNDIIYPDVDNISMRLEECDFTERLINATEQYNNSYSNLKDAAIEELENAKRNGYMDSTVNGFIPITYYDMIRNDGGNYNPYKSVSEAQQKDVPWQIIYTAIMRMVYAYLSYSNVSYAPKFETDFDYSSNSEQRKKFLRSLAKIDAQNLLNVYSGFDNETREAIKKLKDNLDVNLKETNIKPFEYSENHSSVFFDMNTPNRYCYLNNGEGYVLPIGEYSIQKVRSDYANSDYKKSSKYLVLDKNITGGNGVDTVLVNDNVGFFTKLCENINSLKDKDNSDAIDNFVGKIRANSLNKNENPYENIRLEQSLGENKTKLVDDKDFYSANGNCYWVSTQMVRRDNRVGHTKTDGLCVNSGLDYEPLSVFLWDDFYSISEYYAQVFLYIFSVKPKKKYRVIKNNAESLKISILQEGAYYWYNSLSQKGKESRFGDEFVHKYELMKEGEVPFVSENGNLEIINKNNVSEKHYLKFGDYFDVRGKVSDDRKSRLIEEFKKFADGEFKKIGKLYSTISGDKSVLSPEEILNNRRVNYLSVLNSDEIQEVLTGLYLQVVVVTDIADIKWENDGYDCIKNALSTFFDTILKNIKTTDTVNLPTTSYGDQLAQTNYAKNYDFKLSTYLNLKNIYDKWFACNNRQTWLIDGDEANNFLYLDSYYNDIGDRFHINLEMLSDMISDQLPTARMYEDGETVQYEGKSVYEFLSEICEKNSLTFLALPQRFGLNVSTEDMKQAVADMFTPIPFIKKNLSSAVTHTYVCLYSYRPSQHLAGGFDGFTDDSFDIAKGNKENLPIGLQDINGTQIPAFGVTFGKMNQSYFKDISFDMSDMQNTEETIATTQMIAAKGSDGTPRKVTGYGQDLYRIYSNYSYKCEVEMMGDSQIMPLMYFQLNNIPMWRGAYMIISVNHSIRANSMTTRFKGVRMNSNTIPYVKGGLMWVDQTGTVKSMIGGGGGATAGYSVGTVPYTGQGTSSLNPGSINTRKDIIKTDRVVEGFNVQELIRVEGTDHSDQNITKEKPLIVLTPAHTPNHKEKWEEYLWSEKLIKQYIIPKLSEMKFYDGTKYADHIKDASGTEHGTTGYSCKIAKSCVTTYGSDRVISIVPHWNGYDGKANYYSAWLNAVAPREDSVRFSAIFRNNATDMQKNDARYKLGPTKDAKLCQLFKWTKEGTKLGDDPAVWLNCACVLTENWFVDYDNPKAREWIESEDGLNLISDLHVKSIKEYIDSLHTA